MGRSRCPRAHQTIPDTTGSQTFSETWRRSAHRIRDDSQETEGSLLGRGQCGAHTVTVKSFYEGRSCLVYQNPWQLP